MKSSSESILAEVDAGVPRNPFFRLVEPAEPAEPVVPSLSVLSATVGVGSFLHDCWSEVAVVGGPPAAGRGSLSMAASAAVLFRVVGGVVNGTANVPGMEDMFLRHTSLDKTCEEH